LSLFDFSEVSGKVNRYFGCFLYDIFTKKHNLLLFCASATVFNPLALFKNKNVNLAFDDLLFNDTVIKGLRENYEYNIAMYNYGRRITCYIYLTPKDIESVLFPNNSYKDFRGLFKLKIDGEELLCRLEKINDYNPESGAAVKCQFIKER
jgi:hypothetical protein